MDGERLDDLIRWLTCHMSRRGVSRVLAAAPLAALPGMPVDVLDAAARKRKRKKKKTCKGGKRKCGKRCIAATACCTNDECGFQGACESGICDCKSGARFCRGTCIPEGGCCTDEECPAPRVCNAGHCVCPLGQKDCSGFCIPQNRCCDADCGAGGRCIPSGTCAITCTEAEACPASCACGDPADACIDSIPPNACATPICMSTGACAAGAACVFVNCGAGRETERHCVPVCSA